MRPIVWQRTVFPLFVGDPPACPFWPLPWSILPIVVALDDLHSHPP